MNVYKYYPPQRYSFDALTKGYFYFCKVSKLNDPYDASFDLIQSPGFRKKLLTITDSKAKEIMGNYGTCSFCEDKDNKVLWALYADNYKGFVVEFDDTTFESLYLSLQARIPYQKVFYDKKCPDLDDENYSFEYRNPDGEVKEIRLSDCLKESKEMDKLFIHLCSYKDSVWDTEREYRLIAAKDVIDKKKPKIIYEDGGYKIPMPQKAIKSIIIGHNFPNDRLCIMEDAVKKYGVRLQRTKPYIPFSLDFEDVTL